VAEHSDLTRDTVRFILDGEVMRVHDAAPTATVLEYLRETLGRTGTKEGCAEGDCGACTVVLSEPVGDGRRVRYRAVNSCIRFLPTIDGCELITVESLQGQDGSLHPVQQALVDHHASQCGFCTPGFVMSLFALYINSEAPRREQVVNALAGNLCRCTGYRPIIAAGCDMHRYPEPAVWSRADAHSDTRAEAVLALQRQESLQLKGFLAPRTLEELATALTEEPDVVVLAGGTDVGLWVTKQLRELASVIYIGAIEELKQIRTRDCGLEIGAAVPLTDAWEAIVSSYPTLRELVLRFASAPVCNSGTLCGNIANGSPVGDSMPALIALGAQVELRRGTVTRRVSLDQFYLGYQRKDLKPGEFISSVTIPLPGPNLKVASYKVSKRFDQDIAAVCAAFAVELEDHRVKSVRIAFGGMAAIPSRASATEAALIGRDWIPATIAAAGAALATDFEPLSDLRASSDYRLRTAAGLLRRFYLDVHGDESTLRLDHDARAAG
jgi:xanthine dehydrogenase small subunit